MVGKTNLKQLFDGWDSCLVLYPGLQFACRLHPACSISKSESSEQKSSSTDLMIKKWHLLYLWISTSSDWGMRNMTKDWVPGVLWVSNLHRYTAFSGVLLTYFTLLPHWGHVTQMPLGCLQMLASVSTKVWVVHITTPISDRRSTHALTCRALLTEVPHMKWWEMIDWTSVLAMTRGSMMGARGMKMVSTLYQFLRQVKLKQ